MSGVAKSISDFTKPVTDIVGAVNPIVGLVGAGLNILGGGDDNQQNLRRLSDRRARLANKRAAQIASARGLRGGLAASLQAGAEASARAGLVPAQVGIAERERDRRIRGTQQIFARPPGGQAGPPSAVAPIPAGTQGGATATLPDGTTINLDTGETVESRQQAISLPQDATTPAPLAQQLSQPGVQEAFQALPRDQQINILSQDPQVQQRFTQDLIRLQDNPEQLKQLAQDTPFTTKDIKDVARIAMKIPGPAMEQFAKLFGVA